MFRLIRNPDPRKKPPYGSRIDPTHPLAQGLVGCWLFNEGGGGTVYDLVADHKGSLVNAPRWVSEGINLNDGNSQHIENTSLPRITDSDSFTVIVIANINNIDTVSTALCGSRASDRRGWVFKAEQYSDTGKVGFTFLGVSDYVTNIPTPIGSDSFFAATRFGSGSSINIYVDDQKETISVGSMSSPDQDGLVIGSLYIGSYGNFLDGIIKTVYVFNRVLTDTEICQLYAEPYSFILVPQYWYMVDFGAVGTGTSRVYSDITALFDIFGRVSSGFTALFNIYQKVQSDITGLFDVLNTVQSDLTGLFDITGRVHSDIIGVFDIAGKVSSDTTAVFDILNRVGSNLAGIFQILNLVQSDTTGVFDICNLVQSDLTGIFDIRGKVASDLTALYDMAGKVRSDLTVLFDILGNIDKTKWPWSMLPWGKLPWGKEPWRKQ